MTQSCLDIRRTIIGAWLVSGVVLYGICGAVHAEPNVTLEFSTYLNNGHSGTIREVVEDSNGDLIITGYGDFHAGNYPGVPHYTHGSPTDDQNVGVIKLSGDGSQVLWVAEIGGHTGYGGGKGFDRGYSVVLDPSGNIYVAGGTSSTDFPTTSGAYDRTHNGGTPNSVHGARDIYVVKLSPDGQTLVYSTLLGSSGNDAARGGLSVDNNGNAYVVGYCSASDYLQNASSGNPANRVNSYIGGDTDGVVTKVSVDGSSIVWSRFVGGSGPNIEEVVVGSQVSTGGHLYGTCFVRSPEGIYTTDGSTYHGGETDQYIFKLRPDGQSFAYAVLLGTSSAEGVEHRMNIDASGNAYLVGGTNSPNYPMVNADDSTYGGGGDGLLIKLNPSGQVVFSTYFGGSGHDHGFGPALDSSGNIYIAGRTASADFLTTSNAFQSSFQGGPYDAYLRIYSPLGQLLYSTFLGGSDYDYSRYVGIDSSDNPVIICELLSSDFPTTAGSYDPTYNGGPDVTVTKFNVSPAADFPVDFDRSGRVDFHDFAALSQSWLQEEAAYDIVPSPDSDSIVDFKDFAVLAEYWHTLPGIVAHWKLDEAEGGIAYDSIGEKNGTLNGSPSWEPTGGAINGALQFDGVDDYVSTDFILDPADGPFSILAWIKGGAPGQVVISQTNGAGYGWSWLCADSSGNLMTDLRVPGPRGFGPPLVSDFLISDGDWHCIGLVWDTSYRYLYFDGAEVKKDSAPQPTLSSATGGLYFGAANTLTETAYWSGLIDDIRIYDRAISP